MPRLTQTSSFLQYLAADSTDGGRLPALGELSKSMGVSVAALREQLEVARALGLVEVRPRTGMRKLPYTFFPAVNWSLAYALAADNRFFSLFADLRNKIEASYWDEAVRLLTEADKEELTLLVAEAFEKLNGNPVQIPHPEHRQLHLGIYRRLENPFVQGLLEAYWEAYETVGLNVYADYQYLQQVWDYHRQMVTAICAGNYDAGYTALLTHTDLLFQNRNL